jgi:hypothetical protein
MKRIVFLFFLIPFNTNKLNAQYSDSVHHQISINANGNLNQTQDGLTYLFNNQAKFGMKYEDFVMNTSHSYIYGKNPTRYTNKDWNSNLDFNLYKTFPHFYYWGLMNYTSSLSLKINHQIQAGLGIAYKFIDTKQSYLGLSNGIIFESSHINQNDSTRLHYETFRNSLRIQFQYKLSDKITCRGTYLYQPSLNYKDDYLINTSTTIEFKLIKWLSLNTGLIYNKVSRTNRENLIFNYGLIANGFF